MDGIPRSTINEVLLNIPITAHMLGGACIGAGPEQGVVDVEHRVFGYSNMRSCDGSVSSRAFMVDPKVTQGEEECSRVR